MRWESQRHCSGMLRTAPVMIVVMQSIQAGLKRSWAGVHRRLGKAGCKRRSSGIGRIVDGLNVLAAALTRTIIANNTGPRWALVESTGDRSRRHGWSRVGPTMRGAG